MPRESVDHLSLPDRLLARAADIRTRLSRSLSLRIEQLRAALGIRRGVHHGNAYFKELTAQRLARALSSRPNSPGSKDYRVTFPDGVKQIIRCTRQRCYADLMGHDHLHRLARAAPMLRPGSRVLEIASAPMLTGYTGWWLARIVGESGSVVSLIPDDQGARFAARRYETPNLSLEHLPGPASDALSGEIDGAFDAIIHLGLPESPAQRDALMQELWRVLAPGGWMLAGLRLTDDPTDEAIHNLRSHLAKMGHIIDDAAAAQRNGPVMDVFLKKETQQPEGNRGPGQ